MTLSASTPNRQVHLERGRHSKPDEGTCVMELASMVAGEPFSDHPRCVHPTLGTIARTVNDHVGDTRRQTLFRLLPDLMTSHSDDPRVSLMIALQCVRTSQLYTAGRRLERQRRRVRRELD